MDKDGDLAKETLELLGVDAGVEVGDVEVLVAGKDIAIVLFLPLCRIIVVIFDI